MTHYIAHRVNTLQELQQLPVEFGVELDLRDWGNQLVLQHEPFIGGERFEPYLQEYCHGTLILNVKSERIEYRLLELIEQYSLPNYFFLDSSFPMIHALAAMGNHNTAIRYSEFEDLATVLAMAGQARWVWVDCFTRMPLTFASYQRLHQADFRICLVSPELQGRDEEIEPYRHYLEQEGIEVDAICTKSYNISRWRD